VVPVTVGAGASRRAYLCLPGGGRSPEGDVQHWWHPPSGRGVRTRISDDRVWLAFATAHYLAVTADTSVLDEPIPFLEGQALADASPEAYFEPTATAERASLFEHCAR